LASAHARGRLRRSRTAKSMVCWSGSFWACMIRFHDLQHRGPLFCTPFPASPSNTQNDRLYVAVGTQNKDIAPDRLLRTCPTFSKSLIASVEVSSLWRTSIQFVEPRVNINGQYYRDVLLIEGLQPEIRELSEFYTFQQDGTPVHRARETITLLTHETSDFIIPTLWLRTAQMARSESRRL
jgi:hypothetical protein